MALTIWPGRPDPLGATWDGQGTNFARLRAARHPRRAVPVRRCLRQGDRAHRAARADAQRLARLPAGRRARPAVRLPRARPLRPARGPALQSEQAAHRPVCPRDQRRGRLERADLRVSPRQSHRGPDPRRAQLGARHAQVRGRRRSLRLGRRSRARTCPGARRSSTRRTSRASACAIPTCPRSCAAPISAWPASRSSSTCESLGVTAVELLPVHQFVDDKFLLDKGLTQLLGLQLDRLLRARRRATPAATAASR